MNRYMIRFTIFVALLFTVVLVASVEETGAMVPDAALAGTQSQEGATETYIVRMLEAPVVAYQGGKSGFPATAPAPGEKINPNHPKVERYASYLQGTHDNALARVNANGKKLYSYVYSFNGFAAKLSATQAAALKRQADVLMVWQDELRQLETDNSPDFLGLTADGGLWDTGYTGEDVIIGVIDTGIWPEHPSFSDRTGTNPNGKNDKLAYQQIPGWYGKCVPGEAFDASHCNQKLIGAQYFADGFLRIVGSLLGDFHSARDHDGHGTHTASTAGGNANVTADLLGVSRGAVSGIAPRARIAAYKACWGDAGCATSDLTAAIDQAVADGVDVINYSIGSSTPSLGADDIAFLFAADAGVFVATSNGNSGPAPQTTGSPAWNPWITSVGASTQNRTFQGSALLGDDSEYFGASVTGSSALLPLVDSEDSGSELCIPGELDPAEVSGKIVLCRRGAIARVDKSFAVYLAGGAGTILYNSSDSQTQNTDNHWTPTVHINTTDGLAIKAYIDDAGESAVAKINGGEFTSIDAPWMAAFSSRGPNGAAPDIIKPDVTAPGVNILAGNSPVAFLGYPGQLFQAVGGTSMSSPHVAGVFALLKEAHPDWSPAAAKSAIMTTAYQDVMKEDGVTPADPFDMGAGHLNPNPAVDPGLVYDAGFLDYLAFLCGNNPQNISASTCSLVASLGFSFDPSNLNLASIAIGDMPGTQTVHRTVTSVTPGTATYDVAVEAPPGVDVVVDPSSITLDYGESATYAVTFASNSSVVVDVWTFGSLTWTDGLHRVRSPIAIFPTALAAPDEIGGSGADGSLSFDVTFGYDGDYSAAPHGLVAATVTSGNVAQDPDQEFDPDDGYSNPHVFSLSGVANFRIAIPPEGAEVGADIDIFVEDPDGNIVASSTSAGTNELIDLQSPADGNWTVWVHGWLAPGGGSDYHMWTWAVPLASGGSLSVDSAPAAAVLGAHGTVDVSWSGLSEGTITDWYLGAVSHTGDSGLIGLTLVDVDNRP